MSSRYRVVIPSNTAHLAKRLAQPFSKRKLLHAARMMGPTLVAFTFAGVAHAQGTMDFSGAQTLMGSFKTFAIYAGAVICFGGLIFAGIRMMSGRFQDAIPGLFGALFGAGVLGWGAGWIDSQRVDVHPYEEAQGFQRLLDMPGYDVAALILKSGKSALHIYARLSLLQLITDVAQAFVEERITASHANLIARLPQKHQAAAFEQCWRKDWNDKEPHLLPAKHVAAWIETNLYLAVADAPFDCEDIGLNPAAGACVTCPRRSGHNTSLFADVQGDQCLDGLCYQTKVAAHIDHELAARPHLVQIETTWRPARTAPRYSPKNSYRELDTPDNLDAEPPCPNTKSALIVFGRHAGKTIIVCTDDHCPVHDPATAARLAKQDADNPAPVMQPAPEEETEEESEQHQAEHDAEQQRREEERKAEYERQQKEYEAEQKRREKVSKARIATFNRILDNAPAMFNAAQLRSFLRLLVHIDPNSFLEEVASHFAGNDENAQQADEEIVLAALDNAADDKLTGFALRLALTDFVGIPLKTNDPLSEAEAAFAPQPPKSSKPKNTSKSKETPTLVKTSPKKNAAKKQKVA